MNTVEMFAYLIKSGRNEEAIHAVNELVETTCALEAENKEMRARIAELEEEIADLRARADQVDAWEGRYYALLEEAEASRPRPAEGDGSDLPAGTVVIDNAGDAWQRDDGGCWSPADFSPTLTADYLEAACAPYTIVYTPTPKENTND